MVTKICTNMRQECFIFHMNVLFNKNSIDLVWLINWNIPCYIHAFSVVTMDKAWSLKYVPLNDKIWGKNAIYFSQEYFVLKNNNIYLGWIINWNVPCYIHAFSVATMDKAWSLKYIPLNDKIWGRNALFFTTWVFHAPWK